jgi:hypothetical protein
MLSHRPASRAGGSLIGDDGKSAERSVLVGILRLFWRSRDAPTITHLGRMWRPELPDAPFNFLDRFAVELTAASHASSDVRE